MKIQIILMGREVEIEIDNIIGSILTTKSNLTLDDTMRQTVIDTVKNTNQFSDVELQVLQSRLNFNSSFSLYKYLTPNAVFEVALDLIKQNNKTTSLEIRDFLRTKGYWARMKDIRCILKTEFNNHNLRSEFKDNHREWFLKEPDVSDDAAANSATNNSNLQTPKSNEWGKIKIGVWRVRNKDNTLFETIKNCTRNVARWIFAKKNNIKYTDVKANIDK